MSNRSDPSIFRSWIDQPTKPASSNLLQQLPARTATSIAIHEYSSLYLLIMDSHFARSIPGERA
jgi:hypothetical protein